MAMCQRVTWAPAMRLCSRLYRDPPPAAGRGSALELMTVAGASEPSRWRRRSVAHAEVADAPAAVELEVALAGPAEVDDDARRLAVDDAADAGGVGVHDGVRIAARPHVVVGVVGVDHVAPVARADRRRLRPSLAAGVVVAPDHVAVVAADDRVIAIAAEQPVVHAVAPDDRMPAPFLPLVHLQALLRRPPRVAGARRQRARRATR